MCTKGGIYKSWFSRQGGLTLVELIMFIVIVSVGIAGILLVLNRSIRTSADPVVRKQALAIAESLLEEVELMPFTFCDPTDPAVTTATSPASCATPEGTSPTPGTETRYSSTTPFNNVGDYGGFDTNTASPSGIRDITSSLVPGLGAYRAQVSVVQESPGTGGAAIPATESLRITVTVTGLNTTVTLDGYRTRYAPNTT
ncbi:MAG TPA: type II secretion system protein [Burkholderiales bacterium]|nr:type II secretion system protein [Burkholderiales bacterium]